MGRAPGGSQGDRPRLARRHADAVVRSPRPDPRAGTEHHFAAWNGWQRRSDADRFTYPNDIRNTAFLVWEHPNADDERFLFLPALGRVRRIAGEEKQESFVGSDLSYEDIGGRDIADYTWAFADPNASWTAPDGTTVPAWSLESRAKDRAAQFPRSVSPVLKDRFIVVHADAGFRFPADTQCSTGSRRSPRT